jgi:membrane-bound inhibitor of C-type lysozyme
MMTKGLVILLVVSQLIFSSCQNRKSGNQTEKSSSGTELKKDNSTLKNNEIVSSTTTNKDGISLKYTFNNSVGICILELNGEIIELKQERTASGIKYSNEHFIYTNWHGETNLFKDGKLIFSDSK